VNFSFTTIDFPGATWTNANGINRHGPRGRLADVVGIYADIPGTHGFVLSGGHYTVIDGPQGRNTEVLGINNVGQIVGATAE
jgi:hypothetical protein